MEQSSTRVQRVAGLDLGDRYTHLCILNAPTGEIVEQVRLRTQQEVLRQHFSQAVPLRIALEVGSHSPWVSRLLSEQGHDVVVANPRKVRLIYQSRTKDDRIDAEKLARLARADPELLYPVRHRRESSQRDLAVLRSRDALVRTRTRLITHCRGLVKATGERLPACSARSFVGKSLPVLPVELEPALIPVLTILEQLTQQIRQMDRQIERIALQRYPETQRLTQVRGVGTLTALAFILTLEDSDRFRRSREVGPYLGLVPARAESGSCRPQLRITKRGDRYLRSLLVQCGHYILGPFGEDCDLRRSGERLIQRGGARAKKRAAVAVARKLAVLLHSLWSSGASYEPLYSNSSRAA